MIVKTVYKKYLLAKFIVPAAVLGLFFSLLLTRLLLPPIASQIQEHADLLLTHASDLGLSACDELFNRILDLRMEENPEMNTAYKKEAIEQIRQINRIFPKIHMVVTDSGFNVIGTSIPKLPGSSFGPDVLSSASNHVISVEFDGEMYRMTAKFFPFWQWHIVSLIRESDYMASVNFSKRIVLLGTFGVLFIVMAIIFILFILKINRPIKTIIRGTSHVAEGMPVSIPVRGDDEIAQMSKAFNSMVESLAKDKKKIDKILEKLGRSEARYRVLTESSLTGILMVQDEKIVFANTRIRQVIGENTESFFGKPVWEILHPEDINWVKERLSALTGGKIETDNFECRFKTGAEDDAWFEIRTTLIQYKGEKTLLIHAVDISEKREAQKRQQALERKLARTQRMEAIGTLAGGVAHDLNNVLSGIVGYPDLLLMGMDKDDPSRKSLEAIRKSGQKAAHIVQDLLTLARRNVPVTKVVDLNDIISEYFASPEYEKLLSFHPDVHVEKSLSSTLLPIKGSFVHLSKTVMNLVSNAAESMPDGGTIKVTTENRFVDFSIGSSDTVKEGEYTVMTISDTGTGILPEDREKIFEPFYTKKIMGRSGTGLGMAVVWGTVKDHKGYIDLNSTMGKGTTFSLYFPVTHEQKSDDQDKEASLEGLKGNGEKILIVDDVSEQRQIASHMLTRLSYTVSEVPNGEAALEFVCRESVDLLILDMIMEPGMDGLDTYRRILEINPNQKAMISSGFSETDRVKAAQRLGALQYLKKPYTIKNLAIAVKRALENE